MLSSLARELLARRIPQILGVYLAAGWGLLEFTDWAARRFQWTAPVTDVVVAFWLIALPFILVAGWRLGPFERATRKAARKRAAPKSIAVLPFADLSESRSFDYLSDGISEEIINTLSKIEGLNVVSRTSAFAYKGKTQDVRTIGEELSVQSVLEGSVQLAGGKLRVTTQLVNVSDGYHLWSHRFDREMEDVFAIEDEIAQNVAQALRVVLGEEERRALTRMPTGDVRAYEFFLRGRQFFHQTRKKSLEYAREMFNRAIEIDPGYALAWAGIANASALIYMYYPSRKADLEEADTASLKALDLDPELADAQAARGFALALMKRLEEAEDLFERAIELDPKLFEARYFYARACFQQGKLAKAAELFEAAAKVREDYQAVFFAAQSREALGKKDEAIAWYHRALSVAEKHMELNPDDPRAATMRAVALCRVGRQEEGLHWAERAIAIDPEYAGVCYNVACLYALEGMVDNAIGSLERAVEAGFGNPEWVANDPDLAALRGNPRFEGLRARM
jgi:TolB-like protein/Tfp pilus assembly protein PilF